MSDALPLPPHPNLDQCKKLARDLQRASRSADPGAIREWGARWIETLARLNARETTPEEIDWAANTIERQWHKLRKAKGRAGESTLADAQFFIARALGFASWPKFAGHLQELSRSDSRVAAFEAAADAIVSGDIAKLEVLLTENPDLVRARSTREHRSTLLHYVSANGVEDFRQKTPGNIVEIATALLNTGADVNAESDAYGGQSTTLGLTATSCHPEAAGVQLRLMQLLIDRGAAIDPPNGGSAVNDCLHNGRGEAAEYLANRGARLDLEGAAGAGKIEIVQSFFAADGSLKPAASRKQMEDGFAWACEFGRTGVVDFLLQKGMDIGARLKHNGQTGLHWAAYGGHSETVNLLLQRGASVDATDESFGGTPLEWALYAWGNSPYLVAHGFHYDVVAQLARAGAILHPEWAEDDRERRRALEKANSDPRMMAALRGEMAR